jgi:hypothetical protein
MVSGTFSVVAGNAISGFSPAAWTLTNQVLIQDPGPGDAAGHGDANRHHEFGGPVCARDCTRDAGRCDEFKRTHQRTRWHRNRATTRCWVAGEAA